ncbi:MAG: thiamine-phosphate kinase [Thermoanaerobaculia bacterium]
MKSLPPEGELVARLQALFATRRRDVILGIGDDAAVVNPGGPLVLTTDLLIEDQDFRRDADPGRLGRKTLAVNLSDLAAMGATPLYALLSLGLPRNAKPEWFEAFVTGLDDSARESGVAVVGGDLSASGVLVASLTLAGRAPARGVLTRSGAAAGDTLFISGTLGAAAAGLALLEAGFRLTSDGVARGPSKRAVASAHADEVSRLIRHQVDPRAMVDLGRALADLRIASAALDVSDGLARDLHRLCRASGVGATIELDALPIDSAILGLRKLVTIDPREAALFGGEDFGLLFTVPKRRLAAAERLTRRFALRKIGTINGSRRVLLATKGSLSPLPDAGFDHFGTD